MTHPLILPMAAQVAYAAMLYVLLTVARAPVIWGIGRRAERLCGDARGDFGLVGTGVEQGAAEGDAHVLDGVMAIDVQIAFGRARYVKYAVTGELVDKVVEPGLLLDAAVGVVGLGLPLGGAILLGAVLAPPADRPAM